MVAGHQNAQGKEWGQGASGRVKGEKAEPGGGCAPSTSSPLINIFSCGSSGAWMRSSPSPPDLRARRRSGFSLASCPQRNRNLSACSGQGGREAHGSGVRGASRSRLRLGGRAGAFVN